MFKSVIIAVLVYFAFTCTTITAATITKSTEDVLISVDELNTDYQILVDTFNEVYSGLLRMQTTKEYEIALSTLKKQFSKPLNHQQAYLALTEFAASQQCSHTHTNPYNQNDFIKSVTSEANDKLPITVKRIAGEYFVEFNASNERTIKKGWQVLSLNGVAIEQVMSSLRRYVASDAMNPHKIENQLAYSFDKKYRWFDVLLPLVLPPQKGKYRLVFRAPDETTQYTFELNAISAKHRDERIAHRYDKQKQNYDQSWHYELAGDAAILTLSTFATYKMKLDWKQFLDDAFAYFAAGSAKKLIIDIRGNAGGMYDVAEYLYSKIYTTPITIENFTPKVRYQNVAENLKPYLKTWNPAIYDLSGFIGEKKGDRYLVNEETNKTYPGIGDTHFDDVIILVDESNSSATFLMARALKQAKRATLIGAPLGGSLLGSNGGQMFFLKLPHTQVSIDIPVIGYFPASSVEESILMPDIIVDTRFEDWMEGIDKELETALAL